LIAALALEAEEDVLYVSGPSKADMFAVWVWAALGSFYQELTVLGIEALQAGTEDHSAKRICGEDVA
jgi:hypothetical protein